MGEFFYFFNKNFERFEPGSYQNINNGITMFLEIRILPTPFGGRSAASAGPRWAGRIIQPILLGGVVPG